MSLRILRVCGKLSLYETLSPGDLLRVNHKHQQWFLPCYETSVICNGVGPKNHYTNVRPLSENMWKPTFLPLESSVMHLCLKKYVGNNCQIWLTLKRTPLNTEGEGRERRNIKTSVTVENTKNPLVLHPPEIHVSSLLIEKWQKMRPGRTSSCLDLHSVHQPYGDSE